MQNKLRTDAAEITFETFGSPGNPTVFLIAGAGAPGDFWHTGFISQLAGEGFQIVRYCHRDTGDSTHFDETYPITALLADLKALIEECAEAPAHLIGHSMGGYLAQMAMCEFPVLIASVLSISAGPTASPEIKEALGLSSPTDEVWARLLRNTPTGDFGSDLEGWLESWTYLNGARRFDRKLATDYTRALYMATNATPKSP